MAKYTVIAGPLRHDQLLLEDGADVELPKDAAEPLLACGVIAPRGKAAASAAPAAPAAPAEDPQV
jgi:hypothetical protein